MLNTFSDVKIFLERDVLPPATSTKLLEVLDDPAKTRKLKIEKLLQLMQWNHLLKPHTS